MRSFLRAAPMLVVVIASLAAFLPSALADSTAPAWKLDASAQPTHFIPATAIEQDYLLIASNVGGKSTHGDITVSLTVPAPLSPSPDNGCPAVGQVITCTLDDVVESGRETSLGFSVEVPALAEGTNLSAEVEISGGGAPTATAVIPTTISSTPPPFDFLPGEAGFNAPWAEADGSGATAAGAHPFSASVDLRFPTIKPNGFLTASGHLRDVLTEMPPGFLANPSATLARCTEANLLSEEYPGCPLSSQVGTVTITTFASGIEVSTAPLWNMVPPPGAPAAFSFNALGVGVFPHIIAQVRSDGDYGADGASSDIFARGLNPILGVSVQLWGDPTSSTHDFARGNCVFANAGSAADKRQACPAEEFQDTAFLSLPTNCTGQPSVTTARADSWEEPENIKTATYQSADLAGTPYSLSGCNALEFEPTLTAQPTTNLTDSPSGLDVDLHQPQAPPLDRATAIQSCAVGTWLQNPTQFAFQWLRNAIPIPGAEDPTYAPVPADAGTQLQCEISATAAAGSTRAASPPSALPPTPSASPPHPKTPPTIIVKPAGAKGGIPREVKSVAECEPGQWGGSPTFAYRWFENGSILAGFGKPELEISEAHSKAHLTLQCEVIGSNGGGSALAFSHNLESEPPAEPPAEAEPILPDFSNPPSASVSLTEFPPATAALRDATVTLPAGLVINPSQANGLQACSSQQIGLSTEIGASPIHFSKAPDSCPLAAKIGTVEVTTPLLAEYDAQQRLETDPETGEPIPAPLHGPLYLAKPYDNPFKSLLAIYISINDPQTGTIAKLAGRVIPDPATGQITTTFEENPQLPLEDVRLHLFNGARASLITPPDCATHTTTTDLTPWSAPETLDAHPSSDFQTAVSPTGGTCPQTPEAAPNSPTFTAGTVSPQAGAYSPFVLKLSREDGSARLTGFDTTLPPGLTGKLAGIPACTDSQIARAASRSNPEEGILERNAPSCSAASALGTVNVAAGAGPTPFYTQATAYLAGPYKSAPLSMAVITPAIAGPFDLGTVVVRAALYLDPNTAQIHAVSDPFPTILHGIPLDLRSVAVTLDRPSFTLNPTSCDPMAITGGATSTFGAIAPLTSPFQVGGCQDLPFKPKLSLRLKGKTKRTSHPTLIANLSAKPGEANIARAQVKLPKAAFLDNSNINTICTRVQFTADTCPPGSIYGKASATTPLLDAPLSGAVYLRSSSHNLPDLVVKLKGPDAQPIEIDLVGRTDSVKGALRNTFEAVPDAPVSTFRLELFGGKRGLIELSSGLCSHPRATVKLDGQNGKTHDTRPIVKTDCPSKHRNAHKHRSKK